MTESNENLNTHMAKGALWMVSMRWVLKVMGFVNVIILARLLVPEDFGLIAMATILIGLVSTITDGSFDKVILRDPESTPQTYNAAWTAQILAGILATVVIFCCAPLLVSYAPDNDPRLYTVLFIAGLRPAILGFENIGQVEFRRDFDFQKEFRYWIYRRSIGIAIGLSLAFGLGNYLALALALPLTAVSTVILSFLMSRYRPRITFEGIGKVLSFSKWFALLDTGRYLADRLDEFVVIGLASPTTVGHYYMASDVSTMPTREVVMPLERALMPTLAHIGDDKSSLSQSLQVVLGGTIAFCLAAGIGLYAISDIFVRIVLGDQWIPAVPFFEWLSIYGCFSAIVICVQPFFVIGNALRTYTCGYLAYLALLAIALTTAGTQIGIEAIAPVRTMIMLLLMAFILSALVWFRFLSFGFLLSASWRPVISCVVMVAALRLFQNELPDIDVANLILQIAVGIVVFISTQLACWWVCGRPNGIESLVLERVQKMDLPQVKS